MKRLRRWSECIRRTPRISPGGFALYAGLAVALYGVLHALGLRQYVSIASGTPLNPFGSEELGVALGIAYVLLYFAAVVAAPILLIAASVWLLARRIRARSSREGGTTEP